MHELPDLAALGSKAPLVIDCSSHIVSRPIDWSRVGVAYAGAQKNIGPSGVVVMVIAKDLIAKGRKDIPKIFQLGTHAEIDPFLRDALALRVDGPLQLTAGLPPPAVAQSFVRAQAQFQDGLPLAAC